MTAGHEKHTPDGPVVVLGFGTMGGGIAQTCAQAGIDVIVLDMSRDLLDRGRERVDAFLQEGIRRGKVTEEQRAETLGRIRGTTELAELAGAPLVIEAVVEELEPKRSLLERVGEVVGVGAIVATNTSSLSVTELAAAVARPERFAGLHFFNPAQLMPLVEVVRALQTADETVAALVEFSRRIGKEPVEVRDRPGFLVNSLLIPYLNQVIQSYDDGLAPADDLDLTVKLGLGYPMGPLELLDLIGLDVHLHASEAAYELTRRPELAPPPLLRKMVAAGYLGRKTGRGFRAGAEPS
jgi:3-hydroxybutyryl-CoA dehydrogenase